MCFVTFKQKKVHGTWFQKIMAIWVSDSAIPNDQENLAKEDIYFNFKERAQTFGRLHVKTKLALRLPVSQWLVSWHSSISVWNTSEVNPSVYFDQYYYLVFIWSFGDTPLCLRRSPQWSGGQTKMRCERFHLQSATSLIRLVRIRILVSIVAWAGLGSWISCFAETQTPDVLIGTFIVPAACLKCCRRRPTFGFFGLPVNQILNHCEWIGASPEDGSFPGKAILINIWLKLFWGPLWLPGTFTKIFGKFFTAFT